jgi:carboxymethylenebutenolidase
MVWAGLAVVAFGVAGACGGAQPEDDDGGMGGSTPALADAQAASSGHVPHAPTAVGELPPALLGQAPAPQGIDLAYLDGDMITKGYLTIPEGEGPFPAVILVHEWNGLVDRVRQVADAFAAEGYVALAADVYQGRTGSNSAENIVLMQEANAKPDKVVANLNAAAAYLRGRDDVSGKVAVMGWCFGGGIALSYGLDGDAHEGTAMFYGQLVQDPERLANLHHPIYGTFAEQDGGIPPDAVEEFVTALRAAGIENDVHIYDEMVHGFWLHVDQDADARSAPALDAWQRLKTYLGQVLS